MRARPTALTTENAPVQHQVERAAPGQSFDEELADANGIVSGNQGRDHERNRMRPGRRAVGRAVTSPSELPAARGRVLRGRVRAGLADFGFWIAKLQEYYCAKTGLALQGLGHHPRTLIEIATDVKLRALYGLEDGDIVDVELEPAASD